MVDACRGACLMVTMAPEVEGASDALRVFFEHGVVCSAGHTGARYREGMLAIGLGFRSLTHAFNGMPPLDHRDPSLLAAFIQDRRTLVQVICDGFHVSPVMIDILHRTLGDRVVLATDNMPAADPGYHIEGGVMRAADGTIAGSALRIDEALRNYMAYAQIPFAQAIVAATHAPARLIRHESEMGSIARGMRADFSFWDKDYEVIGTMVGGRFVYNQSLEVAVYDQTGLQDHATIPIIRGRAAMHLVMVSLLAATLVGCALPQGQSNAMPAQTLMQQGQETSAKAEQYIYVLDCCAGYGGITVYNRKLQGIAQTSPRAIQAT